MKEKIEYIIENYTDTSALYSVITKDVAFLGSEKTQTTFKNFVATGTVEELEKIKKTLEVLL